MVHFKNFSSLLPLPISVSPTISPRLLLLHFLVDFVDAAVDEELEALCLLRVFH